MYPPAPPHVSPLPSNTRTSNANNLSSYSPDLQKGIILLLVNVFGLLSIRITMYSATLVAFSSCSLESRLLASSLLQLVPLAATYLVCVSFLVAAK